MTAIFTAESVTLQNARRTVSGQAVAFSKALDIERTIDLSSGKINPNAHENAGTAFKNKILVAPGFAFNPDLEFLVYLLASSDNRPKCIVVHKASSNLVLGAVMADIPLLYGLPSEFSDLVRTGDRISIDLEHKKIKIIRD